MKSFLSLTILLLFISTQAQSVYEQEVKDFQIELNEKYKNSDESPLLEEQREHFKGHNFFPINKVFRVEAKFIKIKNPKTFGMKTTGEWLPKYDTYGIAEFEMNGKAYTLNIYQSHSSRESEKYRDYLFLPFTDLTNGEESYGGGRYVDIKITDIEGDTIIIDFNKSYNPYCVYNYNYSCPIPPKENDMDFKIKAGIKNYN